LILLFVVETVPFDREREYCSTLRYGTEAHDTV